MTRRVEVSPSGWAMAAAALVLAVVIVYVLAMRVQARAVVDEAEAIARDHAAR